MFLSELTLESFILQEGAWLRTDGSKFDLKIWGPEEPSNNVEHCLEMNFKGTH